MSAPGELTPAPPHHKTSAAVPPSGRKWKWIVLLVVLGAGGWVAYRFWANPSVSTQMAAPAAVRTARVQTGTLEKTLRLNGATSSINARDIPAPVIRSPESGREMILLFLVKSGTRVKKGDVLAQIDAQSTLDHMEDVKDELANAENSIRKRIAEQSIDTENLDQSLRVSKSELDKARLNLKGGEMRTTIDKELLQLAVDEAEARHKQLQADVAERIASQKADIRILEIALERQKRHWGRHEVDITRYKIESPMDGLAVVQSTFRGSEMQQIQQGDQVTPGQPLLKVVDVDHMQVDATVNQAESSLLRIGQKARVRLDAFPGIELPGLLYSMNPIAIGSYRQGFFIRNVPVRVRIEGSAKSLIPDLSASVDVFLDRADNALTIPLAALHPEGDGQVVYVRRGDQYEKRGVQVGLRNATHAVVVSGVQAGDEVALEAPKSSPAQVAAR